jgi:hypothetical protein
VKSLSGDKRFWRIKRFCSFGLYFSFNKSDEMKRYALTALTVFYFVLISVGVVSQGFPLRVIVGNESTAIPFTRFFTIPVHPAIQIGTDFTYRGRVHSRLYQTVNLGYVFHNHLYQGIWLNTEAGYDYRFSFGLNLKALLGAGYLHTFATRQEYQFKDGKYSAGADGGNPRLMVSLALGVGYRFANDAGKGPEVFLLYKPWIEYPYSPGFIPVMTHISMEAGARYNIFQKKNP